MCDIYDSWNYRYDTRLTNISQHSPTFTNIFLGGYISGSLAIATDAAHLLTDFASFMVSLFSIWMGSRPPTKNMSFGWYRAEVIGALTSVLMIWIVVGILVYLAIQRVIYPEFDINAEVMLITSGTGVVVNLMWVWQSYAIKKNDKKIKSFQNGLYVASAWPYAWKWRFFTLSCKIRKWSYSRREHQRQSSLHPRSRRLDPKSWGTSSRLYNLLQSKIVSIEPIFILKFVVLAGMEYRWSNLHVFVLRNRFGNDICNN